MYAMQKFEVQNRTWSK